MNEIQTEAEIHHELEGYDDGEVSFAGHGHTQIPHMEQGQPGTMSLLSQPGTLSESSSLDDDEQFHESFAEPTMSVNTQENGRQTSTAATSHGVNSPKLHQQMEELVKLLSEKTSRNTSPTAGRDSLAETRIGLLEDIILKLSTNLGTFSSTPQVHREGPTTSRGREGRDEATATTTAGVRGTSTYGSKRVSVSSSSTAAKLGVYDGKTPIELFLSRFESFSQHYDWSNDERSFQIRAALVGSASEILWSLDASSSVEQIIHLLRARFGTENQAERFRSELRNRRRQPNESISTIHLDICRLMSLAFPGPSSSAVEIIGRDAFLQAIDDEDLQMRILEKDPQTLNEAVLIAHRLEAIDRNRTCGRSTSETEGGYGKRSKNIRSTLSQSDNVTSNVSPMPEMMAKLEQLISQIDHKMPSGDSNNATSMLHHVIERMNEQLADMKNSLDRCQGTIHQQQSEIQRLQNNHSSYGTENKPSNERRQWTKNKRSPDECARCHQTGHWARDCPLPDTRGNNDDKRGIKLISNTEGKNRNVYIQAKIEGRSQFVLLDSGCELSVIGVQCIPKRKWTPTTEELYAANGNKLPLVGETILNVEIGGESIPTRFLGSPVIEEPYLGIDFLTANRCLWNFDNGSIKIDQQNVPLISKPRRPIVRRVLVEKSVNLPAHQQVNVPVVITGADRYSSIIPGTVEVRKVSTGILAARTLISGDKFESSMPVLNLRAQSFRLKEGTQLGNFVPIPLVDETNTGSISENTTVGPQSQSGLYPPDSASTYRVGTINGDATIRTTPDGVAGSTGDFLGPVHENPELSDNVRDDLPEHLKCVVETLPEHLTEIQRNEVINLVKEFSSQFSKSEFDIGRTSMTKHTIDTGNSPSFRQPLRRHPIKLLPIIDHHVEEMLKNRVIKPSVSEWCSNVVMVRKSDGTWRFAVDMRQLNSLTLKDSYPLPRIDSCLDALGGSVYFSTLDLRQGYWQVPMEEDSARKTCFQTRKGTFQFEVLAYGLCNAPACFERLMDRVLCGLTWQSCLVYLDDVLIFAPTFEEHLARLRLVLQRFQEANLKLKPNKCRLFQSQTKFLGNIVSAEGVKPDPEKVEAVRDWPVPRNLTEARGFVALAAYYRRHIANFAQLARPLYDLTKKNQRFIWGEAQQRSFMTLKEKLTTAPVLSSPIDNGEYVLDTDCSDLSAGAVLQQRQHGELKVIAYASRVLNEAERNYCTTRKELVAMIFGLKQFRHYLLLTDFIIRVDHAALRALMTTPEPVGQAARWLDFLADYRFTIVHRPGVSHANSDSLSRRPCERQGSDCLQCASKLPNIGTGRDTRSRTSKTPSVRVVMSNLYSLSAEIKNRELRRPVSGNTENRLSVTTIIQEQDNDEVIHEIKSWLQQNYVPTWEDVASASPEIQHLWSQLETLELNNGILYRKFLQPDGRQKYLQLIVPSSLRQAVLELVHGSKAAGHLGVNKTIARLMQYGYWQGWRRDVDLYVHRCPTCNRYRHTNRYKQGPLQPLPISSVGQRLHVDLMGPFVKSQHYKYLLSVICPFTKYLVCVPIADKSAINVAKAIVKNVFLVYGTSELLFSDMGREFCNEILDNVCRLLDIQRSTTTGYRPSSDGAVERVQATISSIFAKMVQANQRNWADLTPFVTFAYNTAIHSVTRYSPFYLMFHRNPVTSIDCVIDHPREAFPTDLDEYSELMLERMKIAFNLVRSELKCAFDRSKRRYDFRVKSIQFEEGEFVWFYTPRGVPGLKKKWVLKTNGPYRVLRKINKVNYVIRLFPSSRPFICHVDRLRKYIGPLPLSWQRETKLTDWPPTTRSQHPAPNDVTDTSTPPVQQKSKLRAISRNTVATVRYPNTTGYPVRAYNSLSLFDAKKKIDITLYKMNSRELKDKTKSRLHDCDVCGGHYTRLGGLRRHLATVHDRELGPDGRSREIPEDRRDAAVELARLQNLNSGQRKKMRGIVSENPGDFWDATLNEMFGKGGALGEVAVDVGPPVVDPATDAPPVPTPPPQPATAEKGTLVRPVGSERIVELPNDWSVAELVSFVTNRPHLSVDTLVRDAADVRGGFIGEDEAFFRTLTLAVRTTQQHEARAVVLRGDAVGEAPIERREAEFTALRAYVSERSAAEVPIDAYHHLPGSTAERRLHMPGPRSEYFTHEHTE